MTKSGHAPAPDTALRHRCPEPQCTRRGAQNPCPATGARKGPCKGWVIDHVKPLACGGADHPDNMQGQTVAEGKAKDKWERRGCTRTTADGLRG